MRPKHFLFLALVIGIPIALWLQRPEPLTPREELSRLRVSIESRQPDEQNTLRRLTRMLRDARDVADEPLVAEVLDTRARYYADIGSAESSKNDLEELLERHRPRDPGLRLRLALAQVEADEPDAGIAMLEALTTDEPQRLEPWVELGDLRLARARALVDEASGIVRPLMVREEHERAVVFLERLAAQDPEDPRRTASSFTLREMVGAADAPDLARALVLVDEAAEETAAARTAFAESFALGLDQRAVSGFLGILATADVDELAVQFGTLGLRSSALEDDSETARILIELLLDREDHVRAARVARLSLESGRAHDAAHLRLLCLALYRGDLRGPLVRAANELRKVGRGDDPEIADLYSALARSFGASDAGIARDLRAYALSDVREPFPGARAAAWFALAGVARSAEDPRMEQEALIGGLAAAPAGHGKEWMRLAELQRDAPHVGYLAPLVSYTRGMCQVPSYTDQLLEGWIELGERALAGGGRDLPTIDRTVRRSGRLYPEGPVDPYLHYRLAEWNLEQGRVASAATILRRLLEAFPGLVPGVDLMIRCTGDQGRRTEQVEWIVRRIELAGADEVGREWLAEVEQEDLTNAQQVRLMAADPSTLGRLYVARELADAGNLRDALLALRAGREQRTDTERLAEGELLFRMGRFDEALPPLLSIESDSSEASSSLAPAVLVSWYVDKTRRIPVLIDDVLDAHPDDGELLLEAGDLLLRVDRPAEAEERYGDHERAHGARADVLLRVAAAALVQAEAARAAEESRNDHDRRAAAAIDRAEALSGGPEVPSARLLLALSVGDERDRDDAVRALSAYDAQASPLTRALAAASADEWEDVQGIVDEELPGAALPTPEGAVWGLLSILAADALGSDGTVPAAFGRTGGDALRFWRGPASEPRASGDAASLLLACETPGFERYALHRLDVRSERPAVELWSDLLEARLLERMEELWKAREVALRVVEAHPDFLPAWTLLERIETARLGPRHPQLEQLRRNRRLAGNPVLARADRALEGVRSKLDSGDHEAAVKQAEALLEAAPEWLEAVALLARAYEGAGRGRQSLVLWHRLCLDRPTEDGAPYVDDFVAAIARLRRDSAVLPIALAASELEGLIDAYPLHPSPVRERAEVDLAQDPENVSVSVHRALGRLEDFRASLDDRTLEQVHVGSLEPWIELCLRLDEAVALRVLHEERESAPGQPAPWRLLGRVLRRIGRLEDSLMMLRTLERMLPDGETQIELAQTSVAMGRPHGNVVRHLREGMRLGADLDERRASTLTARSQLAQDRPAFVAQAIDALEGVWSERADMPREEAAQVGLLYARARLARGEPEDLVIATRVLGAAPHATEDPYLRATMRAMHGLVALERRASGT